MDSIVDQAEGRRSRGLERAFDILDHLRDARKPLRPNEIATATGAPRSTVYELINLLLRLEILEYKGGDGRVFLGRKLFILGAAYSAQSSLLNLCGGILEEIVDETRETAQFCLLDGNKYTVAMMKESSRPFRISSSVGERTPIPWTASGRLLLDHLSDPEILTFVPPDDFRKPSGDWIDPVTFLAEVRQASRDGHFTFDSIVDSYTHCFAVPVRWPDGRAEATLCLVAPKADARHNHGSYLDCLKRSAGKLSTHFLNAGAAREFEQFRAVRR